MRVFLAVLLIVLLSSFVNAATIHGKVYNFDLDIQKDSRVEIDTEPKQFFIAKDGSYSFDAPVGSYTIKAEYFSGNVLVSSASEKLTVKEEGDYVLDFILFPVIEELAMNESDIDFRQSYFEEKKDYRALIVVSIALIFIIFLAFYFFMRKKKAKEKSKEEKEELGDELNKLINFIKKKDGRVTQLDIRKEFPSSEAKISLMISELEDRGVVKKIKKGRGNIIILK